MLLVLYLLLIRVWRSTEEQILETKTVGCGQDVTLSCDHVATSRSAQLFWIRIVSKNWPEVLGGTFSFDYKDVNKTPRNTTKQEAGAFVLHINKTQPSDTGLYYCIKVSALNMTILKGTFLRTKESNITAIIQAPSPDHVHPGDSVTLQCSVLSDSDKKTCPGENSVFWFRAGSDESHPSLIYAHGNSADDCEKSPEAHSPQSCVYSFSKDISSSDNGTYYCVVATCGEILFGKGTKLDIEVSALNMRDLKRTNTVLLLLCAALAFSLIALALWIYTIKNKPCGCYKVASVVLETNATSASSDQQNQQRDNDSVVYSAPTFTKKKAGKAERRNVKAAEGEMVYSDVRTFVIDSQSAGFAN